MWKTTPVTVFFLVTLMPWLDPPGVLSFKWDATNITAIMISALLGFLLQWSGALALGCIIHNPPSDSPISTVVWFWHCWAADLCAGQLQQHHTWCSGSLRRALSSWEGMCCSVPIQDLWALLARWWPFPGCLSTRHLIWGSRATRRFCFRTITYRPLTKPKVSKNNHY